MDPSSKENYISKFFQPRLKNVFLAAQYVSMDQNGLPPHF